MNDLSPVLKNIIPNVIIFITALYVASKDSPLAFFGGVMSTIILTGLFFWAHKLRNKHGKKTFGTTIRGWRNIM